MVSTPFLNVASALSLSTPAGSGIERKIEPPAPIDEDLYDLHDERKASIRTVPGSLAESLDALERDHGFLLKGDGLELLPLPATSPLDYADPAWVERELGPHDFWYYPGIFSGDLLDYSQFFRLGRTVAYQRKFEALRADNEDAADIG